MSKPELTKQLLANTLQKLASTKHLDKISISEIVTAAGLNRQTFYYHFQDKQELICWIFDTNIARIMDEHRDSKVLNHLVEYFYSEKDFYTDALTSKVQNNLRDHLYEVCHDYCIGEILLAIGDRTIDGEAIDLFARMFTNAIVGTLIQWVQEGMKTDHVKFLADYMPIFEQYLALAVNKCAE